MARIRELKQVNGRHFLTVDEASRSLGIKPSAIRNYLHSGKLRTYKFKTLTLVSIDEVDAWRDRRRGRGGE